MLAVMTDATLTVVVASDVATAEFDIEYLRWALMVAWLAGALVPLEPARPGPARRYSRSAALLVHDRQLPWRVRWFDRGPRHHGHRALWAC